MQLAIGFFIGFALIGAGVLFFVLSYRWLTTDDVTNRLIEFVSDEPQQQHRWTPALSTRRLELAGTLFDRTIVPAFRRIANFFGRFTPNRIIGDLERQLVIAGHPMGLGARGFFGLRLMFILIGFVVAFIILQIGSSPQFVLASMMAIVGSIAYPSLWLRRKIRFRQNLILRSLPDSVDMLSVCASAGLGFDQAMQRVSEYWETPMGLEFGRVVTEMEMGLSRKDALRNLADRIELSELSSFVSLIIQSDSLGMSISDALHAMAEQMRVERRYRAQEQARKLPNKILFPVIFFIFPAMFAVLLGPSIPSLLDLFEFIQ
jgi:tight adherence protein C